MNNDRPLLGILLMFGFCAIVPLADASTKLLGETLPLGEVLLVRFALQAVLTLPLVILGRRAWQLRGRILWLAWLRTIFHIISMGLMFLSLRYLPLANAVAIIFVMPFIMLFLGRYFLGEEVGARRMIVSLVGFLGTLLVIQPSFAVVGWPALLPLGVASFFAIFMMITRYISQETDPIGLQTTNGAMAVVIILPFLLLFHDSDIAALQVILPDNREWLLLLALGSMGALSHLLMTWSLRYAPSATLAPMQYLEIPIATLIGWLVFSDLPNTLASFGILVTISAGLYVVFRERAIQRSARKSPPPRSPVPPVA